MRIEAIVLSFLALWRTTNAYSNCQPKSYYELGSGESVTVNSPNYPPYGFNVNTACQFTVSGPIYHEMSVSCHFYIGVQAADGSCDVRDSLQILTDGTTNFARGTAMRFCGSDKTISNLKSAHNSVTIAYTSTEYSGFYSCEIKAISKSSCDCGTKNIPKIVGGQAAEMNQYPYMAAIMKKSQSPILKGGGTILSTNVVVCAAHELWENGAIMSANTLLVTVGRRNLKLALADDTPYAENYDVAQVISHPQYDYNTGRNDIAVILVKVNFRFNRGVQPCCLPSSNEPQNKYYGQQLRAMGYGAVDFGKDYSYYLKYVDLSAMSNSQCAAYYGNDLVVYNEDLCHSSSASGDTCQGDSGGPIIQVRYRDFLACLVKTGPDCAGGAPGMCQKIGPYIEPFIMKVSPPKNYYCRFE
ncbi:venom serine protease-like [Sitodiplosis mosellana]|uniref:venom serine protease-like n=1 Tax=Sitodiplosis mosellana TaxID=263140 RepID=UPI0024449720|nr:venom serine protease-like [Sitodiplosis mosellana]